MSNVPGWATTAIRPSCTPTSNSAAPSGATAIPPRMIKSSMVNLRCRCSRVSFQVIRLAAGRPADSRFRGNDGSGYNGSGYSSRASPPAPLDSLTGQAGISGMGARRVSGIQPERSVLQLLAAFFKAVFGPVVEHELLRLLRPVVYLLGAIEWQAGVGLCHGPAGWDGAKPARPGQPRRSEKRGRPHP